MCVVCVWERVGECVPVCGPCLRGVVAVVVAVVALAVGMVVVVVAVCVHGVWGVVVVVVICVCVGGGSCSAFLRSHPEPQRGTTVRRTPPPDVGRRETLSMVECMCREWG